MKLIAGLVAMLVLASSCAPPAKVSDDVTVQFRYSRFVPEAVTVKAGVPVTIVLQNDDPIEHEWIVGSAATHAAHRVGTEPVHEEMATEVTVRALSTRTTQVTFEQPGEYAFICHLPGHEAYGMTGKLRVLGT